MNGLLLDSKLLKTSTELPVGEVVVAGTVAVVTSGAVVVALHS